MLAHPAAILAVFVTGLFLAAAIRIWLGSKIAAPQLLCDEFIYADVAENLATSGRFALREEAWNQNVLYPALLAPAWIASSMAGTYEIAKAISVLLLTLTAVPLYLWARRLVPPIWALLAPGLALLIPPALYSTLLMTENALLPAFVLATFAISLALERPTLARQGFALTAIALACAARLQALVLLPIFVTAVVIKASLDLRARGDIERRSSFVRSVKGFWPSAAVVGLSGVAYIVSRLVRGSSFASGLGPYETLLGVDYSVSDAAYWTRLHTGDLVFMVGLIPASALVILLWLAVAGRGVPNPAERAFLAVTAAAVPWTLVEAGVFASRFTNWVTERYTFYVVPLFLLALVVWLGRGLPRPPLATLTGLLTPLALLYVFPMERFIAMSDLPNSLGLYALFRFGEDIPSGSPPIEWLVLCGATVLALGFAFLPRGAAAGLLPGALVAFFVASSFPGFDGLRNQSVAVRAAAGPKPSWIDEHVADGDEAVFLFSAMGDVWESSTLLLQAEFWNRRTGTVYALGEGELCGLPERAATVDVQSGRIVAVGSGPTPAVASTPHYVVADRRLQLGGTVIAEQGAFALYRIDAPLRMTEITEGIYLDGWTAADAALTRYSPDERGGDVAIFISRPLSGPPVPGVARITVGTLAVGPEGQRRIGRTTATRRWSIGSTMGKLFVLPAPRAPFRIEVHVEPTFSPADYGLPDPRQLGVKLSIRFLGPE